MNRAHTGAERHAGTLVAALRASLAQTLRRAVRRPILLLCAVAVSWVGRDSAGQTVDPSSAAARSGASAGMPRGAVIERDKQPIYVIADGRAGARILLDASTVPGLSVGAMTELVMQPGAVVPVHQHDGSAEFLYVLEGQGRMTLDGREQRVRAGMAIYIPAAVAHGLVVDSKVEPMRAIQVYTPGGPEARFKKGVAVSN